MGLNTWKALEAVPGLFRDGEEKGRAGEGDESGDGMGTNPVISMTSVVFVAVVNIVACDWFQCAKAGCGEVMLGGVVRTLPPLGGTPVIFTGDRMALGLGRSLELFTEDTI